AAMPARFEVRRTPRLPGANGVQLLILTFCHLHRIWLLRIDRLGKHVFRHRLKLWPALFLVKYLMKLLVNAKSRCISACIRGNRRGSLNVLLNFCHDISSLKLNEQAASWPADSWDARL